MNSNKEERELVSKLLNMYAYAQAISSVEARNLADIKIIKQDVQSEIVALHYNMVEKQSLLNTRTHSSNMFRVYFDDIMKQR